MSNNYNSNSDLDDIDFEEFLTENGKLVSRTRQPKSNSQGSSPLQATSPEGGTDSERPGTSEDNAGAYSDNSELPGPDTSSKDRADQITSDLLDSERLNSSLLNSKRFSTGQFESERPSEESPQESTPARVVESATQAGKQKLTVAFQGEAGAYSEQALRNHFGQDVTSIPCTDFRGIFDAIHSGRSQRGILPVENSLAGTVSAAYDQLADHDLRIQAEVILRVEHCLMAPAGMTLHDIKRVKSHPQALAQCKQTLRRLEIEPIVHYDTAGAARDLAAFPEPGTAAIASALAAKTYGLEILSQHLEDEPYNFTRFFVLGLNDPPRVDPSKTSVIFTTRHQPGALQRVLAELAEREINLTKIESRPRRNRPWHYLFYVDFEGHEDQREIREALLGILKQASFLKVLGSYPAAPIPVIEGDVEARP